MSQEKIERELPHVSLTHPDLPITIDHLAPLLDQVMYRLIHTYAGIDPILKKLQPKIGLNNAAYTFFAESWLLERIQTLYSYDLDFKMVEDHGIQVAKQLNTRNLSISNMDIMNLAFPDNFFDVSLYIELAGTSTSTGYDFVKKSLQEVRRVLKPGGSVFLNFKSSAGEQEFRSHPQYEQLAEDIQDGFPKFRGVPISRQELLKDVAGSFEEAMSFGQAIITPERLPFVYTVENAKMQWDSQAIRAKPFEEIDPNREHPLYWTVQLMKI